MSDRSAHDQISADTLRPTLDALTEQGGDRFAPARFRYIQGLANIALRQRPSVAALIETKALRMLSDYVDDYRAAEALSSGAADNNRHATPLQALTDELQRRADVDESSADRSLENQLMLQEQQLVQSLGGLAQTHGDKPGAVVGATDPGRSGATHRLRESLKQHHLQQRVTRAIQDGPDEAGPLNAQALVIESLSMMRDLSPSYIDRFASYMDTLFWLEDAGRVKERKTSKRGARRKA